MSQLTSNLTGESGFATQAGMKFISKSFVLAVLSVVPFSSFAAAEEFTQVAYCAVDARVLKRAEHNGARELALTLEILESRDRPGTGKVVLVTKTRRNEPTTYIYEAAVKRSPRIEALVVHGSNEDIYRVGRGGYLEALRMYFGERVVPIKEVFGLRCRQSF